MNTTYESKMDTTLLGTTVIEALSSFKESDNKGWKIWPKQKDDHGNLLSDIVSKEEIRNCYKGSSVYRMFENGDLYDVSGSVFVLNFTKKYDIPNKAEFTIDEIPGFKELGLKYKDGNRTVKREHIMALKKSIEDNGVLPMVCVIDKDGNIYDGQNRIVAAMLLGLYVYIIVTAHPNPQLIMDLNSNSSTWTSEDKIRCYMRMEKNGEKEGNSYTYLYELMHLFDDTESSIYKEVYKRINTLYSPKGKNISEKSFHKIITSQSNLDRNAAYAMTKDIIWGGQVIKDTIENGLFQMSMEQYDDIKDFLINTFINCVFHLEQSKKECIEVIKLKGQDVPSKKTFKRNAFYQSCLFKMRNATNKAGERLGDNTERFNAFIDSITVEENTSHGRIIGLKIKDISTATQTDSTLLYKELLDNFNGWNKTKYSKDHGIPYNAATMWFS